MRSRWFHRPIFHTAHAHEKKVTWLELFYDLIFVAAIIQLGDALSQEVTRTHQALAPFAKFAGLFIPLWIGWTGFTFYANRFDVDDFVHRLLVFLKMFCVGAMAIAAPSAIHGDVTAFAIAYAIVQALVALMYLRSWRQVDEGAEYSRYWFTVFAIGSGCWAVAAMLPPPWSYFAMGAGIGAILFSPVNKRSRALTEQAPIDMEHLSERYGLLTIIVLGESFVKVLTYLTSAGHGVEMAYLLKGCFNLTITCCVWWIYFDDVAGSKIRKSRGSWIVWLYGHLPLTIGVTAVGVAVKKAISFDLAVPPDDAYRNLLAAALALTFFSVAMIDSVTERRQAHLSDRIRVNVRFASALLVVLLGPAGGTMTAGTFLLVVTAVCVAQVVFDIMMAPFEEEQSEQYRSTAELAAERMHPEQDAAGPSKKRPDIGEAVRKGTPSELRRDLYFFFMEGSWTRLLLALGFLYLISNVFFAALYLLEPGSITGAAEESFVMAFHFSVQTMSTIGYGNLAPATPYADLIVTIEAAFGLLGVALATGLMFAKASRPQASVLFSAPIVLTKRHGKPTLMFRAGNARGNEVVDATASVSVLRDEISPEGHHLRKVTDLPLERDRSPMFVLSWTIMHTIDDDSPLRDVDWDHPERELMGMIVTILGHDSTYGQTTHARHIYYPEAIRVGHKFVDVIHELDDGRMMIDYTRFHDTEPDGLGEEDDD